jgi:hypothetical protein
VPQFYRPPYYPTIPTIQLPFSPSLHPYLNPTFVSLVVTCPSPTFGSYSLTSYYISLPCVTCAIECLIASLVQLTQLLYLCNKCITPHRQHHARHISPLHILIVDISSHLNHSFIQCNSFIRFTSHSYNSIVQHILIMPSSNANLQLLQYTVMINQSKSDFIFLDSVPVHHL